jgi:hypothetical protein
MGLAETAHASFWKESAVSGIVKRRFSRHEPRSESQIEGLPRINSASSLLVRGAGCAALLG